MNVKNIDLGNYFIEQNGIHLSKVCIEYLPLNCKVLEIGSWKGKSSSIIAKIVKEKSGLLYCIDTWKGSEGEEEMELTASKNDIFNIFQNNMKYLGFSDNVIPIVADSRNAKNMFADSYFDLIFIDGNHKYEYVINDLKNFLPKLKTNGIICGDDCEQYGSKLPLFEIKENRNNDWSVINGKGYHCGVIYALYETFNDEFNLGNNSTFWWKQISVNTISINQSQNINLIYADTNLTLFDKSDVFIPLDIKSVKKIYDLDYIYLEEFMGIENLIRIYNLAYDYNLNWFKNTESNIKYLNISIPEIDMEFLRWFWFQSLISIELKKVGIANSINYIFENKKFIPAEYYYPNSILENILGNNRIENTIYKTNKISEITQFEVIKDKIVLVLHPGEYNRFENIIKELSNEFRNDLCIILINNNVAVEKSIKENYNINSLIFKDKSSEINIEIFEQYFLNFKEHLLETPLHSLIKETIFQFEYLFLNRYPRLMQTAASWHNIFESYLPVAVIGSRLPDAETQLPLAVASELNIVSISIPHSVNTNLPYNLYKNKTHILSSHIEEINQFVKFGWQENNIHLVAGLELHNEYVPIPSDQKFELNKFKILVLVNPCGFDNTIYRTISIPNQINAISKLSEFSDNSVNYEIQFKTHPGFPNKEIFEICGENILSKLLPIDSSLQEVLQNIDLVIGLNYSDAAIVHSVNKRKPVILCWDDIYFLETKRNVNIALNSSCDICYSVEKLIDLIEQFFNNSYYKNYLDNKVNNYVNQKTYKNSGSNYIDTIRKLINNPSSSVKKVIKDELINRIDNYLPPIVSVIIPTYNRVSSLVKAIKSIYKFNAGIKDKFEIIVVDNGSTDQTAIICAEIKKKVTNFVYIYEPTPGLLSGRHAGANAAKGEILSFVDDDIEVTEKWLESIIQVFENPNMHLAGGPTLPIFESEYPEWILYYFQNYDVKKGTGYLSLKNRDKTNEVVDPNEIWGLNFSIRKQAFLKLGGFHPDNIKKDLQYLQGDGETGLTFKFQNMNYSAYYSADIKVFHNVYNNRMTIDYFQERAFYQGVCDSFTQLKNKKDINKIAFPAGFKRNIPVNFKQYSDIYLQIHQYYIYGFYYHQYACVKSDIVYNWVMKEDYFDYQLPQVPIEFHNEMVHLRNNLHLLDKIINS